MALVARVAVAAFQVIEIPAVPAEILAGLREVRADQSTLKEERVEQAIHH